MFSRIRSAVCRGIEGIEVFVETDIARGLPGINIVGLASIMVMESRERIKSAIINSGLDYPRGRITVNLTPASIRKNGSCLDLPIAAGILTSYLYIDAERISEYGLIGELSLEGGVLGVDGALPMIICMKKAGIRKLIIPAQNILEASLISGIEIFPVRTLSECIGIINSGGEASDSEERMVAIEEIGQRKLRSESEIGDYSDICGQENAKRALTIAVTGRHGILMVGSPGCGKTMLASRLPSIMPPMNEAELIETAVIYSAAGRTNIGGDIPLVRPFRDPHSTIGRAGLIGGGMVPVPGEITLAHNGVLFMDEVCEFDGAIIESLRTPIEDKKIVHFRRGESYQFPCDFQLVMAANPCPCGYYGDSSRMCRCTEKQLERYRKKLSGPMMDRIDMRISMEKVGYEQLRRNDRDSGVPEPAENARGTDTMQAHNAATAEMRDAVKKGLDFARRRGQTGFNAGMTDTEIEDCCRLGREEEKFMKSAYEALSMSPRSYKKTLKVARTIADIAGSEYIHEEHLAEALGYRLVEAVNE